LAASNGVFALRDESADEKTRVVALGSGVGSVDCRVGRALAALDPWQLGAAIALFVAVWGADLWCARQGLLPSWFVDLRTAVTAIVAVILGVALYLL
jgi:hypothetical protein